MKLIKSNVKIIEQEPYLNGIYKIIETAGRTCYKSEDKITETSAVDFVHKMINSGHTAMLEHGTVYLTFEVDYNHSIQSVIEESIIFYKKNKYSKCVARQTENGYFVYVTTNYRVIVENHLQRDLFYLTQPTEYHKLRTTAKFICDRGVSHELVRHRVFSFAQESTRYCNYTKDKFGNELTFIQPSWDTKNALCPSGYGNVFINNLENVESTYFRLIEIGWSPQQARCILPNCIKTEIVMTGFDEDWEYFFKLRSDGITGKPHPDMKVLADSLKEQYILKVFNNSNTTKS